MRCRCAVAAAVSVAVAAVLSKLESSRADFSCDKLSTLLTQPNTLSHYCS
jgi:hypothetical protein